MAEESNEGVAYLMALKQTDDPDAAAAATPVRGIGSIDRPNEDRRNEDGRNEDRHHEDRRHEDRRHEDRRYEDRPSEERPNFTGAEGDPGGRFKGAERRRSYRYKCEGSAEVREEGREVRTWATFRDVSLHGCYMEVQATYPVGCVLQMKLDANGVQVECKGTVRVNYPYLGMGIAFQEMSEERVARLREMLNKISRRTVVKVQGTTSPHASGGTSGAMAQIADPTSALLALAQFFENRQTLVRDDFFRILRKSQSPQSAVKA